MVLPNLIFFREFHVAIPWMDLSKTSDKTIGGWEGEDQYLSISKLSIFERKFRVFISYLSEMKVNDK